MTGNSQAYARAARGPDVVGELLHSLCQPLTSLRCILELSLDRSLEPATNCLTNYPMNHQESTLAALQQTDRVIGLIQLIREHLQVEQAGFETRLQPENSQ
jgi:hypothetical protein